MAQNTNSEAFLKLKPLKVDYADVMQNHIRYMRKYKDDQEAKKFARQAKEKEFKRKLAKERKLDLPEIKLGDAQGYYRDQRVSLYQDEAKELAGLKMKYVNSGDVDSKLKYEERREFYKNANETTKAFTEYGKYIDENIATEFNPELDQEKLEFWEHLAKGRYTLTRRGFNIPDESSDTGFITMTPEELNQKLLSHSKFSGKAKFEETGVNIAGNISQNTVDGSVDVTPENERESVIQWREQLRENPVQLNTIAKLNNLDTTKSLSDVQLNELAEQLHKEYTLPKWKTVDNRAKESRERQANYRANLGATDKNDESISIATDESNKILNKDGEEGVGAGKFPKNKGFKTVVNFPKDVKYGSPTTKGRILTSQAKQDDNGKWSVTGFKLIESEDGDVEFDDSDKKYKVSSEKVEITNQEDINAIVKKIASGNGKDQFDNFGDFVERVSELKGGEKTKKKKPKFN